MSGVLLLMIIDGFLGLAVTFWSVGAAITWRPKADKDCGTYTAVAYAGMESFLALLCFAPFVHRPFGAEYNTVVFAAVSLFYGILGLVWLWVWFAPKPGPIHEIRVVSHKRQGHA